MKNGIKCPECKDHSLIASPVADVYKCLNCKKEFTLLYLESIEKETKQEIP